MGVQNPSNQQATHIEAFEKCLEQAPIPHCKKAALKFSLKLDKIERNMFCFENEISDLWKEYIEDDIQEDT